MLALMHHNIELNNLVGKVEAKVYDWGQERPDSVPEHPDILLAADCVYFEPAFPLLQQTLQDLIGARTVCYFCFKKRRRADLHFMKAVRKMFLVEAVEDDPDCDAYTRESIFLYVLREDLCGWGSGLLTGSAGTQLEESLTGDDQRRRCDRLGSIECSLCEGHEWN